MNVPTLMTKVAALRGHPIPISSHSAPLDPDGSEVLHADAQHQIKRAKGVRRLGNVEYTQHEGAGRKGAPLRLRLDLLIPKAQGRHPLVVYVPGGGFVVSPKIAAARMRRYVASAGYVVASVEYRTTRHGATYVDGVADIRAAIRFLRAHADEYSDRHRSHRGLGRVCRWLSGFDGGPDNPAIVDSIQMARRSQAVVDKFGASSLDRLAEGFDQQAIDAMLRSW